MIPRVAGSFDGAAVGTGAACMQIVWLGTAGRSRRVHMQPRLAGGQPLARSDAVPGEICAI